MHPGTAYNSIKQKSVAYRSKATGPTVLDLNTSFVKFYSIRNENNGKQEHFMLRVMHGNIKLQNTPVARLKTRNFRCACSVGTTAKTSPSTRLTP